eukprot:g4900.t1
MQRLEDCLRRNHRDSTTDDDGDSEHNVATTDKTKSAQKCDAPTNRLSIGLWGTNATRPLDSVQSTFAHRRSLRDDDKSAEQAIVQKTWALPCSDRSSYSSIFHRELVHSRTSNSASTPIEALVCKIDNVETQIAKTRDEIANIERQRRDYVQRHLGQGSRGKQYTSHTDSKANMAVRFRARLQDISDELRRVNAHRKRFVDSTIFSPDGQTPQRLHVDVLRHRLEEMQEDLRSRLAQERIAVLESARMHERFGEESQREKDDVLAVLEDELAQLRRKHLQEKQKVHAAALEKAHVALEKRVNARVHRMTTKDVQSSSRLKVGDDDDTVGAKSAAKQEPRFEHLKRRIARFRKRFETAHATSCIPRTQSEEELSKFNDGRKPVSSSMWAFPPEDATRVDFDPRQGDGLTDVRRSPANTRVVSTSSSLSSPKTPVGLSMGRGVPRSPPRNPAATAEAMGKDAVVMLFVHRNATAAERILREALRILPSHGLNLHRLANILRDRPNRSPAASKESEELYEQSRECTASSIRKARLLCDFAAMKVSDGSQDAARALLESALACDSKHPRVLRDAAYLALWTWDTKLAAAQRDVKDKGETSSSPTDLGVEMREVGDALERALASSKEDDDPDLLCRTAHFFHKSMGDLDRAEEFYYRATIASPCSASSHSNYASFLARTRKTKGHDTTARCDRAERYYLRGIEMDPSHANCLGNFATFLWKVRGRLEDGEAMLKRALKHGPTHANNLCKMASLLKKLGKYDEAESMFERTLASHPNNATILGNYANFLKKVRGEAARAKDLYLRALSIDPYHKMNRRNYALLLRDYPELRKAGVTRRVSRDQMSMQSILRAQCVKEAADSASSPDGEKKEEEEEGRAR